MRHFGFAVALFAFVTLADTRAAELEIPPPRSPQNVAIQKGPPNCSRWTDECVNCTRIAGEEAPVCSNIGPACQPKAIRCLAPVSSSK